MMNNSLINIIYNLPFSNKLPGFIRKKLLKNNNITFIPTKLDKLPKNSYAIQNSIEHQEDIIENFNNANKLSFNTFLDLKLILKEKYELNSSFNFLDFGGDKLDFYLDISKEFKNINYFLINLPEVNNIIRTMKNKYNFKNLTILNDLNDLSKYHYDFTYFGSSLQYVNNYEKYLSTILPLTKNYIFISATHFFTNNFSLKQIVVKQLNLLPKIFFLYFFNLNNFLNFFKSYNFKIEFNKTNNECNTNHNIFDHLKIENIKYSDILFSKKI